MELWMIYIMIGVAIVIIKVITWVVICTILSKKRKARQRTMAAMAGQPNPFYSGQQPVGQPQYATGVPNTAAPAVAMPPPAYSDVTSGNTAPPAYTSESTDQGYWKQPVFNPNQYGGFDYSKQDTAPPQNPV